MDTTERYIKMCEKAQEIQEIICDSTFDDDGFNFFAVTEERKSCLHCKNINLPDNYNHCPNCGRALVTEEFTHLSHYADDLTESNSISFFWLPRQDQLQEMLDYPHNDELIDQFHDWLDQPTEIDSTGNPVIFISLEQLWFAFVMWEKYGKQWDDEKEEWIAKGG